MRLGLAAFTAVALVACSGGSLVRAPMDDGTSEATSADGGRLASSDPSGFWVGSSTWSNGRRVEVSVDVSQANGAAQARVVYAGAQCTSEWRLYESGMRTWAADEVAVTGSAACPRNGRATVTLSPMGDALDYDWRDAVGSLSVHGTLKRR
jgi:hypothetical protein